MRAASEFEVNNRSGYCELKRDPLFSQRFETDNFTAKFGGVHLLNAYARAAIHQVNSQKLIKADRSWSGLLHCERDLVGCTDYFPRGNSRLSRT
jgi:hypothetical protein